MLRLADLVIRYRWWVIFLTLVMTGFFAWNTLSVSFNADFSTYLSEDDPAVKQYNRIGDIFGGNDIGVALLTTEQVFDPAALDFISRLTESYEEVEGINYVTSLTNVIDFKSTDWGLEVGRLIDSDRIPYRADELKALKKYVMKNDRYAGNLVSQDGKIAAILLQFESSAAAGSHQFETSYRVKDATDQVFDSRTGAAPPEMKLYFGGLPFLIYNMTLMIGSNLSTLIPVMILLLVGMLWVGFRHWSGVLFPLIVVLVSTVWVTGIMGLLGLKLDMLSSIMPVVLLALGSADGIHLMKRYYELRDTGKDPRQSARLSFSDMGTPIILTTVTTTVGFASLFISDFTVIRQFGALTAVGVTLALAVTLTLLPALLSFGIRYKPVPGGRDKKAKVFDRFAYAILHNKKTIITTSMVVIGMAVWAIPTIEKSVDWSLCLARGSDPYHAEMLLRERFGGSLPMQVVVSGDLKDPAILQLMSRIERRMETVPKVDKSLSMAGILSEMNQVLNNRDRVPETEQGVANLWFLVEDKDEIDRLVRPDSGLGLVQAKLATWHTGTLVEAVDSVNSYLNTLPRTIRVIDLSRLDPELRQAAEKLEWQQVEAELKWYLRHEGVRWTDRLAGALSSDWASFEFDKVIRERVTRELERYLASPQAEIRMESGELEVLMTRLQAHFAKGNRYILDGKLGSMLLETVAGIEPADAEWAAGSLSEIIQTAIGEARIEPMIRKIAEFHPAADGSFAAEAKGILWGITDRYLFLGAETADSLPVGNEAVVRDVPLQTYQAGMPQVLKGMEEALLPTQIKSLMTALLFVLVLLAFIHRSTLIALIAIVPITITIVINFGVMGYLGIGLDSFTAMIASIAIGLGIDTDIHFISRYREELMASGDKLKAMQTTLRTTGVSIVINALAVGMGFIVLLFASGQHIRRFGGLTSLTVIVSATFSLTLLAVLIAWLKPKYLTGQSIEEKETKPAFETEKYYETV